MKKTLVLFAHPFFEYSTSNVELVKAYRNKQNVEFKDLYEEFADFHITTFRERKRIREFERLVFHFPLIWFSIPPLLKLWIDEVFDMTWSAEVNHPLQNKDAVIIVTVGGKENNYTENGLYKTTITELLQSLTLSLNVNNIKVSDFIIVYDADDLEKEDLLKISQKIENTLEKP